MTDMLSTKLLTGFAIVPLVLVSTLAGLIVFGAAKPPPRMPSVELVAAEAERREPLPRLQRFPTRDGGTLAYRAYKPAHRAPGSSIAILVHGSTGSSADMNILGNALQAAGMPAFAPDIRGHGESGRRGDIDYIGQLEDDLTDLVKLIRRQDPQAPIVLVGHSSGGGFVLRTAGGEQGKSFARFVLLAPYLGESTATTRPGSGGWVQPAIPRIVGLSILNGVGITAFNGLPTLAFATPKDRPARTWSFRLMQNFAPPGLTRLSRDPVLAAARQAPGHIDVIAGEKDEAMIAQAYAAAFAGLGSKVGVQIVPAVGHMGVISDPRAIPVVTKTISGSPSPSLR
jgi:alpha-beta hydrolase superfamily lysophospholipase